MIKEVAFPVVAVASFLSLGYSAQAEPMPDYYLGLGVRPGLIGTDSTSFVVDSKAKIATLGDFTLSTRPSVMFGGGITEARLPITAEMSVGSSVFPYAGLGFAYNTDDRQRIEAMVTGGVDIQVGKNLYVDVNLNVISEDGIADVDAELVFTLNYSL
ncbi:MAG: hypothetical protein ACKO4L_04315 [Nodosilinea sp.]